MINNSILTTVLTIAGTKVKTVEDCDLKPTLTPMARLFLLLIALNPTHWLSFLPRKGI
jgi:hypothetical protein